jgi:hypothetical protein
MYKTPLQPEALTRYFSMKLKSIALTVDLTLLSSWSMQPQGQPSSIPPLRASMVRHPSRTVYCTLEPHLDSTASGPSRLSPFLF